MVISFVLFLGPAPWLITEFLWLLMAVALYLKHQGHDVLT
jgi:hypothetical protein